jgi:hypothetical protein
MAALRRKRAAMGVSLERDRAALERVLADEAAALAQLTALEAANRERLATRQRLLAAVAKAEKEVAGYLASVASTKRSVVYSATEADQRTASRALEQARGYSSGTTHKAHGDGVK